MNNQEIMAYFMPPDITKGKKALCVAPHPDDIEIGMGGIVPVLIKAGIEVEFLTVTDGSLGAYVPQLKGEVLAGVRKEEAIASAKHLGVEKCHFLGKKDGSLCSVKKIAWEISEVIRSGGFDMVFAPDPWLSYEGHNDHIVTGKAAAQAFINCNLLEYPENTKTPPANPYAIGFYFTSKPNTVIDITETFALKFEAMAMHKSQLNEELLALYNAYFSMRGANLAAGKDFSIGEGLKVLSPLHLHCFPEGEQI
ncbi:MAG: PIG-L family deacetylase [Bacillota bacterium]